MSRNPLLPLLALVLLVPGCGDDGGTTPPQPTYTVTVSTPGSTVFSVGDERTFQAEVTAEPPRDSVDQTVMWSREGIGEISGSGHYTIDAPGPAEEDAVVVIRARSDVYGVAGSLDITVRSARTHVDTGWDAFDEGRHVDALLSFQAADRTVPGYAAAGVGEGWAQLRRDFLDEARAALDGVRAAAPGDDDALAGLVLVDAAEDAHAAVVSGGEALLDRSPDYAFDRVPDYGASDVRWLTARAALDLGDFDRVAVHLDVLAPDHGLDPDALDFPEQALALLQSLQDEV